MSEIVNLKRARKARERAEREREAETNRARFGVSKKVRSLTKARSEKDAARLEDKKLDPE